MIAKLLEKPELEKVVESDATAYAEGHGWWTCKFTSPGLRGVPDRLFVRNKRGEGKRTVFIEWKKDGEEPSIQQLKRQRELREAGCEVYWFSRKDWDEFKRIMT